MLKKSLSRVKKILTILLIVFFIISVTAASVNAGPVMVKEKKTAIIVFQKVKTVICKGIIHQTKQKGSYATAVGNG